MFHRADSAVRLAGVEACRNFFEDCAAASHGQDRIWVAYLDSDARCTHLAAHPAEAEPGDLPVGRIIDRAARLGSAGMVLAEHRAQRQTSVPEASRGLRQLSLAAEAMDVAIIDHLIFSDTGCTSLRRAGLL